MKGYKSSSVFINFCYRSYKDDFYILILAKPLKVELNKFNILKGVILKLSLYKLKDCQWSEVLERVDIRNNGFKDFNSWESVE